MVYLGYDRSLACVQFAKAQSTLWPYCRRRNEAAAFSYQSMQLRLYVATTKRS